MDQVGMGVQAGAIDASGVVIIDVPCQRCSYNLRGLSYTGRCPECGAPVEPSIRGDLLRFCDPQWLERMAAGARYILWGFLAIVVFGLAAGCIASSNPLISFIFFIIGLLAGSYGTWLLTERNPSGLREHKPVTARRITRGAMLMRFAVRGMDEFMRMLSASPFLSLALLRVDILLGSVELIAMLRYFELLAKRIPDGRLAGRAGFLWQAFGVSLGVVLVAAAGLALPKLIIGTVSDGVETISMCLFFAGLLGMVIFSIMAISLIYRMSKALREQAALARQIWATEAAGAVQP